MDAAQRQRIVAILDAGVDMTVATNREDGYPQATTVSYANDGVTIYFGTGAAAQKARNIARDGRVSLTVNLPYANWDEIRGVSIGGRAVRVTDPDEAGKVGALMLRKFPQIANYQVFGAAMDMTLFRVSPEVVSVLDYGKGFGHTELVRL